MDRKVILMQLGYQFNSYNLMHIEESQIRYKKSNLNLRIGVRCTRACLGLARSQHPRLVLAPVVPHVLAPRGLSQIYKYETLT
jgi:hypothetical protein